MAIIEKNILISFYYSPYTAVSFLESDHLFNGAANIFRMNFRILIFIIQNKYNCTKHHITIVL